ncbi:hypothetical protein GA0116996_112162, partial [Cupriavidus alkaliphilus]
SYLAKPLDSVCCEGFCLWRGENAVLAIAVTP